SVVLPHPEGPTMATNSPRSTSSEKSRSTSTAPNDLTTASSLSGLSFIPPPHAWDSGQLHQYPINDDADDADHHHPRYQQVHAQSIARVPDGEAQSVATGDHLGRHDDDPGEPRRDAQRRDDL